MALTELQSAMNFGEKKALHPFFSKAKRIPSPDRSEQPKATNAKEDHGQDYTETDLQSGADRKKGAKKTGRRKDKNGSFREKGNQASFKSFKRKQEGQDVGKDIFAVDGPQMTISDIHEGISLVEDTNADRQKRRRTVSPLRDAEDLVVNAVDGEQTVDQNYPASSSPWHVQLQIEAMKDSGHILDEASSLRPSLPATPGRGSDIVLSTPTKEIPEAVMSEMPSSPPFPPMVSLPISNQSEDVKSSSDKKVVAIHGMSPKKKQLQINSSGKFSSPVSKVIETENSGSLRPTRAKKNKKKKLSATVTIIKYGSSPESRIFIGSRIEQIIGARGGNEGIANEKPKATVKSTGPSKPTHPFFLGKPVRKEEEPSTTKGPGEHEPAQPPRTLRTSAVTPGKLRAQAQSMCSPDIPSTFGPIAGDNKILRHPGMKEPHWPWQEVAHVRGLDGSETDLGRRFTSGHFPSKDNRTTRKLKSNVISVPHDEDFISNSSRQLRLFLDKAEDEHNPFQAPLEPFRTPDRLLTTGVALQELVQKQIRARFWKAESNNGHVPTNEQVYLQNNVHPALNALYSDIENTLTPFDKGECETQTWALKYAPRRVADVLQLGKEASVLRDWLKSLTVMAVEGGRDSGKAMAHAGPKQKPPKKKRKKAEDLKDFIITSEDEDAEMDELTDPEDHTPVQSRYASKKSLVSLSDPTLVGGARSARRKNAVLLSGPHGCGKTAAVYAVAKEMGFEVFEINPGSRRSGKDVLDKVGDMSENHLVNHTSNETRSTPTAPVDLDTDQERMANALQKDLESGRQGTMTSFFKPASQKKTKPKTATKSTIKKPQHPVINSQLSVSKPQPQQNHQKQSLILFEEVDVLFEEDKQFWTTVMALAMQSKRPIIMTCNDETVVPLDALQVSLHAILRLSPPPVDLATDYLLLLAVREGHVLEREAVCSLYKSKDHDLRASITELNFWCQMSVGDRKGGLEWNFQRWPPGKDVDEHGQILRVASKGTYQSGMGWLSHDIIQSTDHIGFDKDEELLSEAWENWGISPENWIRADSRKISMTRIKQLKQMESFLDYTSAVDIYSKVGLASSGKELMDPTQPPIPEKARLNYTDVNPLLQIDPLLDYTSLGTSIAVRTHLSIQRSNSLNSIFPPDLLPNFSLPLNPSGLTTAILAHKSNEWTHHSLSWADFSGAFDPLAEPPSSGITQSSSSGLLTASSFDRTLRIVVEDLAPYIRSIVAHDLRLEADRLRLSNLLSEGGRNKRIRTTRASRTDRKSVV